MTDQPPPDPSSTSAAPRSPAPPDPAPPPMASAPGPEQPAAPAASASPPPPLGQPSQQAQPSRVARCIAEARARGRHPELAAVLGFLIPGLGHVYLGKHLKGAVAFIFLVGLFAAGLFVTRGECVSIDKDRGHPYAFFAQVGCGLPTGLALLRSHTYEVRKWFGTDSEPPTETDWSSANDEELKMLPKLDEGLLYTMIAGLLNLLLIHDALLGAPGGLLRRDPMKDGAP